MKTVLIITDHFTESGGSRTDKFVKYLHLYGYDSIILTKIEKIFSRKAYSKSSPHIKQYHSLSIPSPFRILSKIGYRNIALLIERYVFLPDTGILWVPFAILQGAYILFNKKIAIIYSTSPHESTHLIALTLRFISKLKWVADFRDLWSQKKIKGANEAPSVLHERIIELFETLFLSKSNVVIANTMANKMIYVNQFKIHEEKIIVIPNGFDPEDITFYVNNNEKQLESFSIGYNGFFGDPFPWKEFFNIIYEKFKQRKPIECHICGYMGTEVKKFLLTSDIKHLVKYYGIVSHQNSITITLKTHILLLLLYETGFSDAIIPMKLYNYIAMGRPILAIAGESGSTANLIAQTKTGFTFSKVKLDAFSRKLDEFYLLWEKEKKLEYYPEWEVIRRYDRKFLTKKLSEVFNKNVS